MNSNLFPQIKICGLTRVDEAEACVRLGADAIGLVFFPKSPRHVAEERALEISTAVSDRAKTVGVFVNASFEDVMQKVRDCRLSMVQLHGQESPETISRLANEGVTIIKALFVDGVPTLSEANHYAASAFLVECSKGPLPGGNAMVWNWGKAKAFGTNHPLILAGGLSSDNVGNAVADALPLAVDVSSGVERAPGRKDIKKVSVFIDAVSACRRLFSNGTQKVSIF